MLRHGNSVKSRPESERDASIPAAASRIGDSAKNLCAMENFQIEQATSHPKRSVVAVALSLLALVGVALVVTPGTCARLDAMPWRIDSKQGNSHRLLAFGSARLVIARCVVGTRCTDLCWVFRAYMLGICHQVGAVGRLAGRRLRWRCLASCPSACPAARDIGWRWIAGARWTWQLAGETRRPNPKC